MVKTECQELATRHSGMAAGGREAWISTSDGALTNPIVIFPERPAIAT